MATRTHLAQLLVLMLAFSSTPLALAQSAPDLSADFELPEGLSVSLWAESPDLYNPTAFDIDERGRIWVTEAVNYRKWEGRNPGREHPEGDRVMILEDTDGDGRCDSSKVFVQEAELVSPLGICVIGNAVYVSCSPNIIRYTDLDGDDLPDQREVFLSGFGGRDHDHGVHSLVASPDGFLYGAAGNAGPHLVTDSTGWTLRAGSLYRSGGQFASDNKPGLISDDGKLWTGGILFRVRPDGSALEVMAHNFRNQYEVALDSYGNMFTADNDDDGNASCRTLWVLPGANYGYCSADGSRSWQADQRPGQDKPRAHWHSEDPGVAPNGTINGAGAPAGVAVYEGRLLAPWIDGAVLNCDAGAGVVYAHQPELQAAGIKLLPGNLIAAKGVDAASRNFRPSDVLVGIDGAVYVADWFDPGVGGHQAGDAAAYGRILRIEPKLKGSGVEPAGYSSPAINVRNPKYWQRTLEHEDQLDLVRFPRQAGRLIQSQARPKKLMQRIMANFDLNPLLYGAAVLSQTSESNLLKQLASAASPVVRRSVATLLARSSKPRMAVIEQLLENFDASDPIEVEAVGLAAEANLRQLWPKWTKNHGNAPRNWSPRFEALAWRLHPPAVLSAWEARAMEPSLSLAQRRRAVDAIAFMSEAEAAAAMVRVALQGPADLADYARWWSEQRSSNTWRAFGQRIQAAGPALESAERVFSSPVLRAGSVEIDVDVEGAELLWLVAGDGADGNACDWADWIEPRLLVVAPDSTSTEIELSKENWLLAEAAWGTVGRDLNAAGGELRVDGVAQRGLGTHANSRIAFALPPGSKRFRTRAALDDGGTQQSQRSTSVSFEVYLQRSPDHEKVPELKRVLLDTSGELEAREQALEELAKSPEGGMLLMHLKAQGELPKELSKLAAELIFRNEDLSIRALASQYFEQPGASSSLPTVAQLLAMTGDAQRGKELFFGEAASCAKCHALLSGDARRGLDIGPELTQIRKKFGPAQILDAILNPSAGIAFGYDTWVIEDREGRLYAGFLLADGPTLVIKDTQGERHVIDSEDVIERWKQDISSMPEGLALGMQAQDLADLVAFLGRDPEREPSFGEARALFDGKSLQGWTHHLADAAAERDSVWTIEEGELLCSGNPVGYLRTLEDFSNFELSLEWRFDPAQGPGNSGVLLRMHGEDKIWPKSIEAQLQHRNAGDIWNIDGFDMDCDPGRSAGRHTARVQLSSEKPIGEWNRYTITLDHGNLRLEVNGVHQNTARWCQELAGKICLQSEGAAIRFRNIRLRPILN